MRLLLALAISDFTKRCFWRIIFIVTHAPVVPADGYFCQGNNDEVVIINANSANSHTQRSELGVWQAFLALSMAVSGFTHLGWCVIDNNIIPKRRNHASQNSRRNSWLKPSADESPPYRSGLTQWGVTFRPWRVGWSEPITSRSWVAWSFPTGQFHPTNASDKPLRFLKPVSWQVNIFCKRWERGPLFLRGTQQNILAPFTPSNLVHYDCIIVVTSPVNSPCFVFFSFWPCSFFIA